MILVFNPNARGPSGFQRVASDLGSGSNLTSSMWLWSEASDCLDERSHEWEEDLDEVTRP